MTSQSKILVEVNERTFLRLLIGKRDPNLFILDVNARIPFLQSRLERWVSRLIEKGRASPALDLCPSLEHLRDAGSEVYLYNVFAKLEPWMNAYFEFHRADDRLRDFSMAYKAAVCNHFKSVFKTVLIINELTRQLGPNGFKALGLPDSTRGAVSAYVSGETGKNVRPSPSLHRPAINMLTAVLVGGFTALWCIKRSRRGASVTENVRVMLDYVPRYYNHLLYEELADANPVIVLRGRPNTSDELEKLRPFRSIGPRDGCFSISQGLVEAFAALKRLAFILRRTVDVDPHLFLTLSRLPYEQVTMRALFNMYRPRYYFSRDEDIPAHVLRRSELHRVGASALGNLHGLPSYANLRATFRYINYDKFYVMGQAICRYYRETWAEDMELVIAGSHGARRADYANIDSPRPNDIAIFSGVYAGNPKLIEIVRSLANRFPERTIWMQLKPNYANRPRGQRFIEQCVEGLENVRYTREGLFDIFSRVSYSFSDSSTAVIEALQFGVISYFTDVSDIHESCVYRDFPDLGVFSADDCIAKIEAIESGAMYYDKHRFGDLVDLSGKVFFDTLREDIGLCSKREEPETQGKLDYIQHS